MRRSQPNGTVLQVAHVVRNVESSIERWVKTFEAGPFFVAPFVFDGQSYRGQPAKTNITAAIGCMGTTIIELAQPNDASPSIFNEVLQQRGEGLHHYWLHAHDFDGEIKRYQALGCPLIGYGDLPGIGRGAFVDTSAHLGCFVELLDLVPKMWDILEHVLEAHQHWDGRDPIRQYPSF